MNVKRFGGSGGGKGKKDEIWISCKTSDINWLPWRKDTDYALKALMDIIEVCTIISRAW